MWPALVWLFITFTLKIKNKLKPKIFLCKKQNQMNYFDKIYFFTNHTNVCYLNDIS